MREARIEAHLKKQVEKHGGICRKWVCPGYRGAPDRIVIWPGAIFFVETKAPKGRLSAQQRQFHKMLAGFGFDVVVLNTKEKVSEWVDAQSKAILREAYVSKLVGELIEG
jgi:hypothetical protein